MSLGRKLVLELMESVSKIKRVQVSHGLSIKLGFVKLIKVKNRKKLSWLIVLYQLAVLRSKIAGTLWMLHCFACPKRKRVLVKSYAITWQMAMSR